MAVTKLLYMKDCGKGFPGKHLKAALDYISDADKTQGGRLIAGVNCRRYSEGVILKCDLKHRVK